ncbi:site-specific recombinase XerD [Nitrobacteraceae bacterium AZCC 2161]
MHHKTVFHYDRPCPEGLEGCPYISGGSEAIVALNAYLRFRFRSKQTKTVYSQPLAAVAADKTASISASSCTQYAHALTNFEQWLQYRSRRTLFCFGEEDLLAYKEDMAEGVWSEDGSKLFASIIRSRVLQAIEFGLWSAVNGYRRSFSITIKQIGGNHDAYPMLRVIKDTVLKPIPEDERKGDFLEKFHLAAYYIAAVLMLYGGLRIDEVINIKVDDVPLASLADQNVELFKIHVEGKGRKTRPMVIGRDILQLMSEYFEHARRQSLELCKGKPEYEEATTYFLLNEFDGRKISDHTTREHVKSAGYAAGMYDLTPHTLRHWYATSRLRQAEKSFREQNDNARNDALKIVLKEEIAAIREDLGHTLSKTTKIYLDSYLKGIRDRAVVKHQNAGLEDLKARRSRLLASMQETMVVEA